MKEGGGQIDPSPQEKLPSKSPAFIGLTNWEVTWIFCHWRLVLELKVGKEITAAPRFGFLDKFFENSSILSEAEDNTLGPLNRGGIIDLLWLRTLLAIGQKSWELRFWEVIVPCVLLA